MRGSARRHLSRAAHKCGSEIWWYLVRRAETGELQFYGADLEKHVCERCAVVPGTALRILRAMRQEGTVHVVLRSRARGLYELRGFRRNPDDDGPLFSRG